MRTFLLHLRNALIFFFVSTVLMTIALRWVPVYMTPLMIIRCVEHLAEGDLPRMHHQWVPLTEISRHAPQAVMASEDNLFLQHNGFDFEQISNAIAEERRTGRRRGASTISQQTAKNVFLWNGGGWVRKGFEVYFTFLIEHIWGKQRIMEVYLNSIETGDGIYGVEAVARINFGKPASKLTVGESALIAATLPSPLKRDSANPTKYLNKRRRQIVDLMGKIETFPMPEAAE